MKFVLIFSIFASILFEFKKVSISNELKNKANSAFQHQEYLLAIRYYHELHTTFKLKDEGLLLNLSHSYFKIGDLNSAAANYKKLISSSNKNFRSLVNHQLGVIAAYQGKEKQALTYFKNALKSNYKSEASRFNYELIAKKLEKDRSSGKTKASNRNRNEASATDFETISRKGQGNSNSANGAANLSNQKDSDKTQETDEIQEDIVENIIPSQHPNLKNEDKNDIMIDEKGEDAANALQTNKFSEIHLSEARAKKFLEQVKEQEFLMLLQLSRKTQEKNKTKTDQDW